LSLFPETAELAGENLACRRGERLVFRGLECRLPPAARRADGPNRSGKSSLLRLLAMLLVPAAGRLRGGAPVTDPARYRRCPLCRAPRWGEAGATPRGMLGFWAALRVMCVRPSTRRLSRSVSIRSPIGLPLALGRAAAALALARLIAAPAPVWLLDEPGAALDTGGEGQLEMASRRQPRAAAS
jgi:heme exporter protein A